MAKAIYQINPDLLVNNYANIANILIKGKDEELTYKWYAGRMERIMNLTGLDLESPFIQIMALGFVRQNAKDAARDTSRGLLRRTLNDWKAPVDKDFSKPEHTLNKIFESIFPVVSQIRVHEKYIELCTQKIDEIAKAAGINEEQVRFIFDIGFSRNKGFDNNNDKYRQAIDPVIFAIASGHWEKVEELVSYLFICCGNTFPEWRKRIAAKASNVRHFDTFNDFKIAIANGSFSFDINTVPEEYRDTLFGSNFKLDVERMRQKYIKEILDSSLTFAKELINKLTRNDANVIISKAFLTHVKIPTEFCFKPQVPLGEILNGVISDAFHKDWEQQAKETPEYSKTNVGKLVNEIVEIYNSSRRGFSLPEYLKLILLYPAPERISEQEEAMQVINAITNALEQS